MFKKFKFSLLIIAFAMFVGVFVSCAPQPSGSASIYGTWKSNGDGYTITETTVVYDDGGWGFGYTGIIEEITNDYIFYSLENKTKFYAICYKNLTEISCDFSNAYKDEDAGGKAYCDSLENEKKEFTIENGYYGIFGEYVRN